MREYVWEKEFEKVKKIIDDPNIQIVSFDIFDTLLVRSAIYPKDILSIVSQRIFEEYSIDVYKNRLEAEGEVNNIRTDINDIWKHICIKQKINPDQDKNFISIEIETEKRYLYSRHFGKALYEYALSKRKTIIAVSDMYLPSNILSDILKSNGYLNISKIYVSCENGSRKDSGDLFDLVISKENVVNTTDILHIGDNYISDYKIPISKGLRAFYLPSNLKLFLDLYGGKKVLKLFGKNTYADIIYGFAINELFDTGYSYEDCFSLKQYAEFIAFPMLLHSVLVTLNSDRIQNSAEYRNIYFAARDGYLPMRAYEILSKHYRQNRLESKYLYASRSAYSCLSENNIFERISDKNMTYDYTLKDFIVSSIMESELKQKILKSVSAKKLLLSVKKCRQQCIDALITFETELRFDFERRKKAAFEYYESMFGENESRYLIFDCGYSGSVSSSLFHAFERKRKFDKIYLWETLDNIKRDEENATRTFLTIGGNRPAWMDVLIEDTFSPLQGSCIGFCYKGEKIEPVFEEVNFSDNMQRDLNLIHKHSLELVNRFGNLMAEDLIKIKTSDFQVSMDVAMFYLSKSNLNNPKIFINIVFPDRYCTHNESESLGEKMIHANKMLYGGTFVNIVYRLKRKIRRFRTNKR